MSTKKPKPYWEKLKDPRWQRKRLEKLKEQDFRCEVCADAESTLHVHHKQYFKGREPWEYELTQLAVLCEECHRVQHESDDPLNLVTSHLPMDGPDSRTSMACLINGASGLPEGETLQIDPFSYYAGVIARNVLICGVNIHLLIDIANASEEYPDQMFLALVDFAKSHKDVD